jgi:hypothetical protein
MSDLRKRAWQWSKRVTASFGELTCALFYERSLAETVRPPSNPLGASIRLAEESDLDTICQLYADDPWLWLGDGPRDQAARGLYLDRLRRGERCFLAFVDGVLAHANWTCFTLGATPCRDIRSGCVRARSTPPMPSRHRPSVARASMGWCWVPCWTRRGGKVPVMPTRWANSTGPTRTRAAGRSVGRNAAASTFSCLAGRHGHHSWSAAA